METQTQVITGEEIGKLERLLKAQDHLAALEARVIELEKEHSEFQEQVSEKRVKAEIDGVGYDTASVEADRRKLNKQERELTEARQSLLHLRERMVDLERDALQEAAHELEQDMAAFADVAAKQGREFVEALTVVFETLGKLRGYEKSWRGRSVKRNGLLEKARRLDADDKTVFGALPPLLHESEFPIDLNAVRKLLVEQLLLRENSGRNLSSEEIRATLLERYQLLDPELDRGFG